MKEVYGRLSKVEELRDLVISIAQEILHLVGALPRRLGHMVAAVGYRHHPS